MSVFQVSYKMDCINVAGRLLGHRLQPSSTREELRRKTRKIWQQTYSSEPFDLVGDEAEKAGGQNKEFPNGLTSKIAYNIEEAALRQWVFYHQVQLAINSI